MKSKGRVFKQCACTDSVTGKRRGGNCPRLNDRGHGSWYFHCSTTNILGRPQRVRRGGFPSQAAARRARDELLTSSSERRTAQSWTVARWLEHWLQTRTRLRPTTKLLYTRDIQRFLVPHVGRTILSELTSGQLNEAFRAMARQRNKYGRPHSASTLRHARATLRAALNAAIREGLLTDNPARRVELPNPAQTQARIWTDENVAAWQETGVRPAVAVWTAPQFAAFLAFTANDPLHALWRLIGLRGLRRGEVAGLRWSDINLDANELSIVQQRVSAGHHVYQGPPKSVAGQRVVALDKATTAALIHHRQQQQDRAARRIEARQAYRDTGYVFTRPDGQPYHPGYFTQRFAIVVKKSELPPIRLHDLRHGAASLAHSAGADLKTIQDQLGHSRIDTTADVYTSVLPTAQHEAAAATAELVRKAARDRRAAIRRTARKTARTAKKPGNQHTLDRQEDRKTPGQEQDDH
ncbi:tyrosine-type recombinase/integrase [Micromonospora aurantiaca (nom. illeg.)]|uniref:tyrosine-type recombinase/integrase n=1 Tax=Micromonospora aurantiaca (nom. illeg.) TaxID=47850 RepID=UPI001F0C652A|nr:tyrosine-type recombinase/integrase [Micromonospora aurantiaca]